MEEVIIIADNRFPVSYAATTRVFMICRLFQALNFKTIVYIINVKDKRRFHLAEENIECRWFPNDSTGAVRYFKSQKQLTEAVRVRKHLKYVILYQEILFQTRDLIKLASQNGFEVIAYFDEWYEWGKTGAAKLSDRLARSLCIRLSEYLTAPEINKKIVISRALKKFYRKDNCLLLPTVVDVKDTVWEREDDTLNDKIVIMYAGWPGNRDDLRTLVETIDELSDNEKRRVFLKVFSYATPKDELRAHIPELDRILRNNRGIIEFAGEVTREKAIAELKRADFSFLLREDKWTNNVVFSTKIGESMAAGVPMFTNETSDIGYYIKDGFNGIIIEEMSKRAVACALQRILRLSEAERKKMRQNAYRTAERFFDFRSYEEPLKKFLESR